MALGALTITESVSAQGPVHVDRVAILGDGAYSAGGSTGLLAKLRVAKNDASLNILAVIPQSDPSTTSELEYDHANEKLLARVRTTGVESAVADQSAITYRATIISG